MKKLIVPVLFAFAVISCGDKKADGPANTADSITAQPVDKTETETDSVTPEEANAPVIVTVKGKVAHILPGKDGYMAEITDDTGKTFFMTVSIPNMKDPKQYKQVKIGDVVTVKGESWKMDDELHIKVEELE